MTSIDSSDASGWGLLLAKSAGTAALASAIWLGSKYVYKQSKRQGRPILMAPGSKKTWKGGSIPVLERFMNDHGDFDNACVRIIASYPEELKSEPMFELDLILDTFVIITSPDAYKEAIVTKNFPKSHTYSALKSFLGGTSLAISPEAVWKNLRKTFNPSFTFAYLRTLVPVFTDKCQELIKRLDAAADSGKVIPLHADFVCFALDVIYMAVLSTDLGCLAGDELPRQYHVFMELQQICADFTTFPEKKLLAWLPWNMWHTWRLQKAVDTPILNMINKRLADRAAAKKSGGTETRDILTMALDTATEIGRPLKTQEILDQVKTFLFAGHDTAASTMAFAVYEISCNPAVQAAVIQEVDTVLGGRVPTCDDLSALKYVNAVVKETLRFWPVAGTARVAPPGSTVQGYDVGGKVLYMPLLVPHRDPAFWGPDAGVFRPERWLDEAYVKALNPNVYQPFSKGARDCIGQTFATLEMKAVLAMLYQRFTFTYAGEQPETNTARFTSYPKYRVPVTVTRRATKPVLVAA